MNIEYIAMHRERTTFIFVNLCPQPCRFRNERSDGITAMPPASIDATIASPEIFDLRSVLQSSDSLAVFLFASIQRKQDNR